MSFQPFHIASYEKGLQRDRKPFQIFDSAFQVILNAYIHRGALKKREGIKLAGRLRRVYTAIAAGNITIGAGTTVFNLFTQLSITDANPSLEPGSISTITLAFGAPFGQTFTDATGTGVMTGFVAPITGVCINYATGDVTVINSGAGFAASALTATINYYPNLPVMGINRQELPAINVEQTVFHDTSYVYSYDDDNFNDTSTTSFWSGSDSNFFWSSNDRGTTADSRLLFETNFASPALSANNRIRYTSDLATWTSFEPPVDTTNFIFQCKLIIPYYGRLLFLNTWEGVDAASSVNYFNRCRFSQIGSPIAADAWRSDQFGKGGFVDAPTSEAIVSLRFYKNTLIVFFERSSWELRYVGEYGLPFIWERFSADLGSESTYSTILFDHGVLAVGDRAIITANANSAERIDLEIPDEVFNFNNQNNGKERVHGIRDYQKELVYWCYSAGNIGNIYPNRVLIFNYRNQTWTILRDNVTTFGILTNASGDSWDLPISWDSATSWDTFYQGEFPTIVSGNQQGFVHYYQLFLDPDPTQDNQVTLNEHESLYIKSITRNTSTSLRIESPSHNLEDLEYVYIAGLVFADTSTGNTLTTDLNNRIFKITVIDTNNFDLSYYDFDDDTIKISSYENLAYSPAPGTGTYMGGGVIALLPILNVYTKDFNPYQDKGFRLKSSYVDFQVDATPNAQVTVYEYVDSNLVTEANLPVYNPNLNTSIGQTGIITNATQANPCVITSKNHGLVSGNINISEIVGMTELNNNLYTITVINNDKFSLNGIDSTGFTAYIRNGIWWKTYAEFRYVPGSSYTWQRFYGQVYGQYLTLRITYSDYLMNLPTTHKTDFQLNKMTLWTKPAGTLF